MKKLTRADLPMFMVVTGEDLGQYAQIKQVILERIGYDPHDLNTSYFDLSETDFELAALDLESLSFFADDKVVILDQFLDITTSKKAYLDDKQLKRFESYVEQPIETTHVIIFAPGKLDSKRRLVKRLKRDDIMVVEANKLKEVDFRNYFQKQAQQQGLSFDVGVFDELVVKSGLDFSEMSKNLTFLKAYKSDGHISSREINDAIPKTLQDNIFDLTQLVLQKKIDEARALVTDLTLQGEDEIKIVAVMLGQLRLFTQIAILVKQGLSEQQMLQPLSDYLGRTINPYQVKFALRDSRGYSLERLKKVMLALIEADYQMKSGVYEKNYLLDLALIKIAHS